MKNYPKEILEKIEKSLLSEKKKLSKNLQTLIQEDPFSDPGRLNDNAAVDTNAKEEVDHERIAVLQKDVEDNIADVDSSLKRIKTGTYGFCDNCGQMIDTDRLSAVPTARYCIQCEKTLSQVKTKLI